MRGANGHRGALLGPPALNNATLKTKQLRLVLHVPRYLKWTQTSDSQTTPDAKLIILESEGFIYRYVFSWLIEFLSLLLYS
jgi:hypothetical protein